MTALARLAAVAGFLVLAVACQTSPYPAPIPGTTYRIDEDIAAEGSEVRIDILTTEGECANAKVVEIDQCVPYANRSTGEMKLAFHIRDPVTGTQLPRSLDRDSVKVSHNTAVQEDFELIPHDPTVGGQLFVLVIDGSGSMYANDGARIRKVYEALLAPEVARGFLPEDNGATGVVLLQFSQEVKGLDGGPPRVIRTVADYRRTIKEHLLKPHGGYTHLYGAVRYSLTELMELEKIKSFLAIKSADPTIVVLTDGFNNEEGADLCRTNVDRLNSLLNEMHELRRTGGAGSRATVYTVGFGRRYRPGDKPEGSFKKQVTVRDLCGPYADYKIDPELEELGIDHISLAWIAEAGGGFSFVKVKSQGLAESFAKTASARYRWFELFYRVPHPWYHRQSFEVKLRLQNNARAETTVRVHPSPWIDGPGGVREEGSRWTRAQTYWRSVLVVLPTLGVLIFLFFVGPAFFNARRALFRRARPRSRASGDKGDTV